MTPEYIIIHHSAGKDTADHDYVAIKEFHTIMRHWRDIGYHFCVEMSGPYYEVTLGRMWNEQGAHCIGYNARSLGVCCVGNFDAGLVPQDQWELAKKLVKSLTCLFDIPIKNVLGHNEVYTTACPGKNFNMKTFRKELRR